MSAEAKRRLIVLFLMDVNRDQEEALIQMKFPRAQTPALFSQIDASKGCDHLVAMILNTRSTALKHFYCSLSILLFVKIDQW